MTGGFFGKILRVDLGTGAQWVDEHDEVWYRTYMGGWGFVAYYLLEAMPAAVDPLGPDNLLVFATGVLTGATLAGSGRSVVGAKSPRHGGFGAAEVGGYWGAELAHAGWDAIVVQGRSSKPVYLWIRNDVVEIRSAEHLWGTLTGDCQRSLRTELADDRIRVTQIGPAGEKLSPLAAVMSDVSRAAARTGLGAVMGSKNLKAVALRGTLHKRTANPQELRSINGWYTQNYKNTWAKGLGELGTAAGLMGHNETGGLPTRNFREGQFEGAQNISAEVMRDSILVDRDSCYACPVRCKRVVAVEAGNFTVDPQYGGPEYETIGSMGSICGVDNLAAIAKANELCNAYGIDTISVGVTIAWAMECFERGLLTTVDTGGLELRFGDADMLVRLTEMMGRREGFGRLLSEGAFKAAGIIGKNTIDFVAHAKGQEVPMHEPRVKYALGIGYAVSPTGADHNHNFHDTDYTSEDGIAAVRPFGVLRPLAFDDLSPQKMRLAALETSWSVVMNTICICGFVFFTIGRQRLVDALNAVSGWDSTLFELLKAGERAYTLARVFNVREGLTEKDDRLATRFFQPFKNGPSAGNALPEQSFMEGRAMLYSLLGWDGETGIPHSWKLHELGVGWADVHIPRQREPMQSQTNREAP